MGRSELLSAVVGGGEAGAAPRLRPQAAGRAPRVSRLQRLDERIEGWARAQEAAGRGRVVGRSPAWRAALRDAGRVAPAETTVLLTGESGTGKEVVARLIHGGSPRAGRPFVAINCAALPETLLESELFGHERGAFTGAVGSHAGKIEQAQGGTLFLDEVGEMRPQVQAKLLRVLQEREFHRVGGSRALRADVRVIAATHRDLGEAMRRGEFRADLFYRLDVFAIHLPPLRQRREDIPLLAEAFLAELGARLGRASRLTSDAVGCLLAHPWPGNVRELRNAIERALLLCDGGAITRAHLPKPPRPRAGDESPAAGTVDGVAPPGGDLDLRAVDRGFVERAYRAAGGNKSRAARLLGLSRAQLLSRLQRYGIR
jgi:transcriptional regulator with GAF, ATPase, and Fis domain